MAHLEYHATKLYGRLVVAQRLTLRLFHSRYRVLIIYWIAELEGPSVVVDAIQNNSCLCRQSKTSCFQTVTQSAQRMNSPGRLLH